ncbi:MAG: peptide/nickel transport system ATP-binding protein [Chloroflexota bacterium]|nr:peptide/nickel transport system ATP-binding protein [Chloroflexota bacterium]
MTDAGGQRTGDLAADVPMAGASVVAMDETSVQEMLPSALESKPVGEMLLEVRNLQTSFKTRGGVIKAVTGVDLWIRRGEILGLVGESGCGKSVTSLSILGLLGRNAKVEGGPVLFDGKDLLSLRESELRELRGDRITMIFQQPTSALNPVMDVGFQVGEVLEVHRHMKRKAARNRALELMRMVGIPDPKRRIDAYPHEMSGGMAQRVMIAMALACEPELLIADEPTTALDVTIQAQILDLMRNLQRETGTAIILITHDLGVVAEMCDRVAVMYAGEIVEQTDVRTLFADPKHPYTRGLIDSVPVPGRIKPQLDMIPGNVPNLISLPPGCRFAPRCTTRVEYGNVLAESLHPDLREVAPAHDVRCWLYHTVDGGLRPDPRLYPDAPVALGGAASGASPR